MTTSIIEQELERLNEVCIQDHCDECTNSAIQKALEELNKNKFCWSETSKRCVWHKEKWN